MTIRIISDREVTLQMQIDVQGKALQKAMNEAIAMTAERDEYQQAADKMAMEHKVERDTLRQQLAEAQALIEASRKQEPVLYKYEHIYGYLSDQYSPTQWKPTWVEKWLEIKLYTAPVVADDVLKDAQRYRWLRDRSWRDTTVCVVADPKNSVKLGSFCPSHELLDAAIDEAMGGAA